MKSQSWHPRIIITLLAGMCLTPQVVEAELFHATTSNELVDAILAANSSSGPTVIKVAAGHYQLLERFDSDSGPSGLPPITSTITLIGTGTDPATTILKSGVGRILTVVSGGRLIVRNMTLTGSGADIDNTLPDNGGGAAANFAGFLRFDHCVVSQNVAFGDSGFPEGGAIISVDGRLELEATTVENNSVDSEFLSTFGGAIALVRGTGLIRNSIIRGNRTGGGFGIGRGGGILVHAGTLTISRSTIAGNFLPSELDELIGEGSGIFNTGTVWLTDSAVIENLIGADSASAGSGGGIYNAGVMRIKNGTVSGNTAGTSGGGIFNSGRLTLQGATIAGNHARGAAFFPPNTDRAYPPGCSVDAPSLCAAGGGGLWNDPSGSVGTARTVFAQNTLETGLLGPDCAGRIISSGSNAVGDSADCRLPRLKGVAPDLLNVDPRLGGFEDNGVAGQAHFPLEKDSPLIDAGGIIGTHCTFADQLGQRRVDGNNDGTVRCDIGAVEFPNNKQ
jgi:hypothetical protein